MTTPRHHTPRRHDRPTRGGAVAAIARAKQRPLLPWQSDAVDVALEVDPETGTYAYGIVVVSVQRQAGKTKLESDVADHRCLTVPRARVWITMQNGKTVDEWMREEHFANLREGAAVFGTPGTARARYTLSKRAGSVGVKWPALGSTFTTFPPKRDALHSKQSDLVLVDEAWAHSAIVGADLRQAIRPTMNSRPGAQLWVVSTEGDDSSAYFDDYVSMARASLGNPTARVCFIDYGIADDADAEDLDAIAAAHPAFGHTLTMQGLLDARDDFTGDPSGWARAYGNRRSRSRSAIFPAGAWTAAGRPLPDVPDTAGIGLDATPSGDRYALAAGWRDGAQGHVELLAGGPDAIPTRDTPDLVGRVVTEHGGRLTVDRASIGVLDLVDQIAREFPRIEVDYLSTPEYGSACTVFERGIVDDTVHHHHDDDLDAAVDVATRRPLGDGATGWGRKTSTGSIAELVAVTLALRGADRTPARRKPVVRH